MRINIEVEQEQINSERLSEFGAGMKATIPMVVGAIPFGIIFGALGVSSGLSPLMVQLMSLLVFAGSSQFIGANLAAVATAAPVIVLTTLVVNLRHALYGVSLAPHMKHLPQRWLAPLTFWLTDESYVLVINRYNQPDRSPYKHWFFFGSAILMYINWNLCTLIGIVAGQRIANPERWGLDFAMTVTFTGMVVPLLTNRPMLVCAVVSGVSAVALHGLENKLGLMIAALLGVVAGYLVQWRNGR